MRTATRVARRAPAAEQLEQDDVLLEGLEDRAEARREVGARRGPGWPCRPAPPAPRAPRRARRPARATTARTSVARPGSTLLGQRLQPAAASVSGTPAAASVELGAQRRDERSRRSLGEVGADVDDPLLDPAGVDDEHDQQPVAARAARARCGARVERVSDGYCTTATWRVSEASSRTVRSTTSSRSTAPSRNVRDRPALGRRSAA